jgi:CBS domain-containing protein
MAPTIKSCNLIKPVTVGEDEPAINVAKKLHDFQERRVFVVSKQGFPLGIISIVDINDRLVARGKDSKKTKAKEIMSFPLNTVFDINKPLDEAIKTMVLKDNFYCPVVEKNILTGVLTYNYAISAMQQQNGKKS